MSEGRLDMPRDGVAMVGVFIVTIVTGLCGLEAYLLALTLAFLGAGITFIWAQGTNGWSLCGVGLALLLTASIIFLLSFEKIGFFAIVFLMISVWSADTCAYLVGRSVGGAKLWPSGFSEENLVWFRGCPCGSCTGYYLGVLLG